MSWPTFSWWLWASDGNPLFFYASVACWWISMWWVLHCKGRRVYIGFVWELSSYGEVGNDTCDENKRQHDSTAHDHIFSSLFESNHGASFSLHPGYIPISWRFLQGFERYPSKMWTYQFFLQIIWELSKLFYY